MLKDLASRTFYDTFVGTADEEDFPAAFAVWFNIPALEARIADPLSEVYIAEDASGTPAGFAIFRWHAPLFTAEYAEGFELQNLYLEKWAHGTGLAHELMQLFFDRAQAQNCNFLWLGVWEHNYRAQRFYTKMGFAYTGHDHPFPIHNTPQIDQWWSREIGQ
jgi:ribosomal protein S18 acetylase RimI-like enzyme